MTAKQKQPPKPQFRDWDGQDKDIGIDSVGVDIMKNNKKFTYSCEICGFMVGKAYNDDCPRCNKSEMTVGDVNDGEEIMVDTPKGNKPFECRVIDEAAGGTK